MTHHLPALARQAAQASAAIRSGRAQRRAANLAPIITELRIGGATSLRALAAGLDRAGVAPPQAPQWSPVAVKRVLDRIEQIAYT